MPKGDYKSFHALEPFFSIVMDGLTPYTDGEHYFYTLADDVLFEFRYKIPGWPETVRGRANLIALYSSYGENILLERGDRCQFRPRSNCITLQPSFPSGIPCP